MKKIVSIVGARPQFIKAASISRAFGEIVNSGAANSPTHILIHTGQHYDYNMSKVFFEELEISHADYNLGIGSHSHGAQTGRMLESLEETLLKEKPDWVIVYGDTNTTLAGALSAVKLHIKVAHVEAGLRSFNRRMPEEINRVVADHVSDMLLCPTKTAVKNLKKEGVESGVELAGDVMYDCSLFYGERAKKMKRTLLEDLRIPPKSYYLTTFHRAENTDDEDRMRNIISALSAISSADCQVIFPIHPRTKKLLDGLNIDVSEYVNMIPPVSYLEMFHLEMNSKLILTDSGGVQKEAFFYRVPCVTLRDETEWVETVEAGVNILAGAEQNRIIEAVEYFKDAEVVWGDNENIFGDGKSAKRIVNLLLK